MTDREIFDLHTKVMVNLGFMSAMMSPWEQMIGEAREITEGMIAKDPGNPIAVMVLRLLMASQELIAAHKEIVALGDKASQGGLIQGKGSIQ